MGNKNGSPEVKQEVKVDKAKTKREAREIAAKALATKKAESEKAKVVDELAEKIARSPLMVAKGKSLVHKGRVFTSVHEISAKDFGGEKRYDELAEETETREAFLVPRTE